MEYRQITKGTLLPSLTFQKTNFIHHLEEKDNFCFREFEKTFEWAIIPWWQCVYVYVVDMDIVSMKNTYCSFVLGNSRKHSSKQLSHDADVVSRNWWIGHCQGWTEAGNRSGICQLTWFIFILSFEAGFLSANRPKSPPSLLQDHSIYNNAK